MGARKAPTPPPVGQAKPPPPPAPPPKQGFTVTITGLEFVRDALRRHEKRLPALIDREIKRALRAVR